MASKFLGIFGGKPAPGGVAGIPSVPPPEPPPVAPQNSPSQMIGGGRRRVTQRLILGGKGGASSTPETGRIKLPGAVQAEAATPDLESVDGVVEIPLQLLLRCFPGEFLGASVEDLAGDPAASGDAALPLSSILPQLPSGKVEFAAADLAAYLPPGWAKSVPELGEYASYGIQIPLPELIQRIHPDYLTLRSDQKPIDASVAQMSDPFTPDQLLEAQAKARALAQPVVPDLSEETPEEVAEEPPAWAPGPEVEPEETAADGPELSPAMAEPDGGEVVEAEMPPEEAPTVTQEETVDADLSFTQSEAFQAFLRQMQEEEASAAAGAPAAPAPEEDTPTQEVAVEVGSTPEGSGPTPPDYDFPSEAPTQVMDQAAVPVPEEAEGPEFAPTRLLDIVPAAVPAAERPAFSFPRPVPVLPVSAQPEEEPAREPDRETQSLRSLEAAGGGRGVGLHTSIRFSRTLALRLRYQPEEEVSLRELLHRMNTWPGMKGCILGGRDGLTISAETQDTRAANTLSAFAPKIMGRVSELFRDLGYEEINELQTTTREGSVFIFRQMDLFFISLFDGTSLPASYRELIGQTLEELSRWHHSNA